MLAAEASCTAAHLAPDAVRQEHESLSDDLHAGSSRSIQGTSAFLAPAAVWVADWATTPVACNPATSASPDGGEEQGHPSDASYATWRRKKDEGALVLGDLPEARYYQ